MSAILRIEPSVANKSVLPAIFYDSEFIKERYSKPVGFGNNLKDEVLWKYDNDNQQPFDPYKILPDTYSKLNNQKHKVFCLISDGECDEGSNWEAILFSSHHNLDNLFAIVDYNKLQSIFSPEETLNLEPFKSKWESFGWNVLEVDGHDHDKLRESFNFAPKNNKPVCIICHTVKGKGVSFMENNNLWHYRSPQGKEYFDAKKELEEGS